MWMDGRSSPRLDSLDIGSDTLTGVNDEDYQPPFKFTGKLNKVTLALDRPKLTPQDIETTQGSRAESGGSARITIPELLESG
jgi:arylsulfatase